MKHYIYKITCLITQKYYYGMHSTKNLNDGYFGGGKHLKNSVNKHGKENHIKEIVEYLSDRDSLKKREREIVNEEMLKDPLCMNLKIGGEGGGQRGIKRSDETRAKMSKSRIGVSVHNSESRKKIGDAKRGKEHSQKTKDQMSKAHLGNKNGLGWKPTEEQKEKRRQTLLNLSPESRKQISKKISNSLRGNKNGLGWKPTEEQKEKRRLALQGRNKPKVTCPHCGKIGGKSVMERWHFDNCKELKCV